MIVKSQSMESFMTSFKEKKIDLIIKQCTLPFEFLPGSMMDDEKILTSDILREKLVTLFQEKYFDHFFKGKRTVDSEKKLVRYLVRDINEKGELESESSIVFYFKKINGNFKLYRIFLFG